MRSARATPWRSSTLGASSSAAPRPEAKRLTTITKAVAVACLVTCANRSLVREIVVTHDPSHITISVFMKLSRPSRGADAPLRSLTSAAASVHLRALRHAAPHNCSVIISPPRTYRDAAWHWVSTFYFFRWLCLMHIKSFCDARLQRPYGRSCFGV